MAQTTTTINHHKRKRSWEKEFYKNGYPSEVIVIEDSPTPPPPTCTTLPANHALDNETNTLRTYLPPLPLVTTTTDSSSSTSSHESLNTSLTRQQQQQLTLEPDPKRTKYTIQPYQSQQQHHNHLYHHSIPPLSAAQSSVSSRHQSQYYPHPTSNAASSTSITISTDNFINQSILAYHIFPSTLYSSSSPNQPPPPPLQQPTHSRPKRVQQRPPVLPPPPPPAHSTSASATNTLTHTANTTTTAPTAAKNVTEPCDDRDGHYIVRLHQSLTSQYQIVKLLGQGTFGKVVQCYDHVRRTYCAIKIIRAVPKYRDASKIEIRVLDTLKQHDPLNLNKCIHLIEWFDYRNHICMVFELLGQSVFDYLKSVQFRPFSAQQIQQLAKQLLTSVAFLHDLKLVHTDLKPENILLVRPPTCSNTTTTTTTSATRSNTSSATSASSSIHSINNNYQNPVLIDDDDDDTNEALEEEFTADIRLIDFGSATFEQDYHSAVVSTRHYRAPEIILGIGWSYPCDMWSIGCILVEFFTGDALFQTHDNLEHLCMMATVLGDIPVSMIQKASKEAQQKFFSNKRLRNYNRQQFQKKFGRTVKPLEEIVPATNIYNSYLLDLLIKLLVYEPEKRLTAREALRHPFFQI